MEMSSWSRFGRHAVAICVIALLAGFGQCGRRSDATPGVYVRSTQETPHPNRKLIVFVHGFTGDRDGTWTYAQKQGGAYWPKLVAMDPDLASFDVYVASYFTKALKPGKNLHELASDLNLDLQQHHVFERYDAIFFVAHSMGNLVVREAMLDTGRYRHPRVPLIVSLGAPSNGSEIARICDRLLSNQQCRDMVPEDRNTWLQLVNDDWKRAYPYVEIACAYETLDSPGAGGRVVDRANATSFCTRIPKSIGANHTDMVKPKGLDDEIHLWLKLELLAKPQRLAPFNVVLVDSAAIIYDGVRAEEGILNMHSIREALQTPEFPFVIHEVPVHAKWHRYDDVLAHDPDLVIMHFSSLYGKTSRGDPEGRLRNFLSRVLHGSKAKIIVYSRWDETYRLADGSTLGPMDEFLMKELGSEQQRDRSRVQTLDVNSFGLKASEINWTHPVLIDALKERVRKVLDLPANQS